ncbi:hypothetical protein T265_02509 [Opisthorchis viverrini]|uniref:Uncharacterized protein n=1 Tax=Opisthorchis viverrini TaxID=6198 RepID=A0A075AI83_OPIVI|nr:hypothetical protein T265_02509 [Opisthorchis viverrini]KER31184.1 hypothetical protein T265_02509 [Opisthorchis viverrini]
MELGLDPTMALPFPILCTDRFLLANEEGMGLSFESHYFAILLDRAEIGRKGKKKVNQQQSKQINAKCGQVPRKAL